jgi:RNA polymerase sigma-70 factor (ECF subfamily)
LDIARFEILYKTYQPGLVNFAYFYLKNEQEAIDTVQELFMNIWEKREAFPTTENPKAYLMTAVKHRCFNKLNRNKVQNNSLDTLEEVIISPDTTVSNLEAKQTEATIKNAINTLPEKCREIFILSRYEQLSYKEIANILGISAKTVENQISNAIKVIRKSILIFLALIFSVLENILKIT